MITSMIVKMTYYLLINKVDNKENGNRDVLEELSEESKELLP